MLMLLGGGMWGGCGRGKEGREGERGGDGVGGREKREGKRERGKGRKIGMKMRGQEKESEKGE